MAAVCFLVFGCKPDASGRRAALESTSRPASVPSREDALYPVDEYPSIQAAFDAAAEHGGTVVFGAKRYEIPATLSVSDVNVRVRGQGRATILVPAPRLPSIIDIGDPSKPRYPYSANEISDLMFDFRGTDTVAIRWLRWGQIGVARNIHFMNPGESSVGIATASNMDVNELVFEGINWWHEASIKTGSPARGVGLRINANNCKVLNSTFIGARIAIDLAADNALSAFSVTGCRFKQNGIALRAGGGGRFGGFSANVSDSRFERNSQWDLEIAGTSTEHPWYGIFLRGLFFSTSAGISLRNTDGVTLDTLTVKDVTQYTTSGRSVFIVDGSGASPSNLHVDVRNIIRAQGTTIERLVAPSLADDRSRPGGSRGSQP